MNAFIRPGALPTKAITDLPAWRLLLATILTWGAYITWYGWRAWWQDESGILAAGQKIAAQWPLDAATAASFAFRPPEAWLQHPLAADAPLGVDFIAAAFASPLLMLGLGPGLAISVSGLLIALLLLAALVIYARSQLESDGLAWLAATLLLTAGGLGFVEYFNDLLAPLLAESPSWSAFKSRLAVPPFDYTMRPLYGMWLGTPLLAELIPNRALMLGIAATLPLLMVMFNWHGSAGDGTGYGWPLMLGAAAGLLPAIDATALLVFAVAWLCIAATCANAWRHWLAVLIGLVAVAAPLLLLLHGSWQALLTPPEWQPGGPALIAGGDTPERWLTFWWQNRGLFLPMALLGLFFNRWWSNPLVMAGILLFALLNLYTPPQWLGDSGELLVWSQLLLALPVAALIRETFRRLPLGSIPVAVMIFMLTASGGLDLWRGAVERDSVARIWGPDEVTVAEQLRALPNAGQTVLATQRAAHWVSGLTGRPVLGTDPKTLQAAGMQVSSTGLASNLLVAGAQDRKRLEENSIAYVAFGPSLSVQSGVEDAYRRNYPEVIRGLRWRVYGVAERP